MTLNTDRFHEEAGCRIWRPFIMRSGGIGCAFYRIILLKSLHPFMVLWWVYSKQSLKWKKMVSTREFAKLFMNTSVSARLIESKEVSLKPMNDLPITISTDCLVNYFNLFIAYRDDRVLNNAASVLYDCLAIKPYVNKFVCACNILHVLFKL